MAQLTVDVSMTDAMSLSGMQQGSPSPRHAGVAAAAGQWEMARGNATASHACDASVQVLMQAREQATASNWFDPSLPVAVVGMDLVQAGMPSQYDPTVAMATVVETLAAVQPEPTEQVRGASVQTGIAGPMRTMKKDRQLLRLADKWRCAFCKAYGDRSSEQACGTCGAPRQARKSAGAASALEAARFAARSKSAIGRKLNAAGSGQAAGVKRHAVGEAFDRVQKAQNVRLEISELESAIGGVHYLEDQESNMSVIEGFLVVHYLGKMSIVPGSGKGAEIDGTVAADFFNALGRLTTAGGERNFPMGGYYNLFRAGGVTGELLRALDSGFRSSLGEQADALMKNANTFRVWYTSAAGGAHDAYHEAEAAVKSAAAKFFARLYEPGGRLGYTILYNHTRVKYSHYRSTSAMVELFFSLYDLEVNV